MAIFHCSVKIIGRGSGRSAVAASSYRSGSVLEEKETGKTYDYTRKSEVVYSEINLPLQAPEDYYNREVLWNSVHEIEKNRNAQLAREVEVALPVEFSRQQQIETVRSYVKENFVDAGMCADWSIHDKGTGNPHAHIMLTMRSIKENGQWAPKETKEYARDENGDRIPMIDKKTGEQKTGKRNELLWKRITVKANDWNDRSKVEEWRKSWAEECNKMLEPKSQIDHRSYKRQNIDKEPTIHEGYRARQIEREGLSSYRCEYNRIVRALNDTQDKIKTIIEDLQKSILWKGRDILERINERVREHDGNSAKSGEASVDHREPADGDRPPEETERKIEGIKNRITSKENYIHGRIERLLQHRGNGADRNSGRSITGREYEPGRTKPDSEIRNRSDEERTAATDTVSFLRNARADLSDLLNEIRDSGARAADSEKRRKDSEAQRADREVRRERSYLQREQQAQRAASRGLDLER